MAKSGIGPRHLWQTPARSEWGEKEWKAIAIASLSDRFKAIDLSEEFDIDEDDLEEFRQYGSHLIARMVEQDGAMELAQRAAKKAAKKSSKKSQK